MPKHLDPTMPIGWRPAIGLLLGALLIAAFLMVASVAFFKHGFGVQRGDNADYFPGSTANVIAGVAAVGGAFFSTLWAVRSRLAVYPHDLVVQGPIRAKRIPRGAIERVWTYGNGWLRIRYVDGGHTRYLTTGVTQGYLGVKLFGHETRSALAAKTINELLGLPAA